MTNNSGADVQQILLTPPPGSTFTLSQQVYNLSTPLHSGDSTTLSVHIGNVTPGVKVCFFLTMMSNEKPCCTIRVCPNLPSCCATATMISSECAADGSYTLLLSIVNTSANPIQHIYLYPPAGVTMTPNYFAVSLPIGGTFLTPPIKITGAHPGDLCFHISLHTAEMKECCSIDVCVKLPDCNPVQACAEGTCCARAPKYSGTSFGGQKIAAVTGFKQANTVSPTTDVLTVFDMSGANAFSVNANNSPPQYNGPATSRWNIANLGSIFGVAIDHLGNIYVTATSAYNIDNFPQGPGRIYKIANGTGAISNFNAVPLPNAFDTTVNSFPSLGNISFDCVHKQFFVTNLENGKIYRLDMTGNVSSTFDPGAPDNLQAGFAPLGERLWAVKVHNGRVYYSVWNEDCNDHNPNVLVKNQIRSIGLNSTTGDFNPATDDRLEVEAPDLAATDFSNPTSDISFAPDGKMLLTERTMNSPTGSYAHSARALEYACTDAGWVLTASIGGAPYRYNVGVAVSGCATGASLPANAAGGNDYDYDPTSSYRVWVTGDYLRVGPNYVYGLQGFPFAGGTIPTSPWVALYGVGYYKYQMGDVAVSCPDFVNKY